MDWISFLLLVMIVGIIGILCAALLADPVTVYMRRFLSNGASDDAAVWIWVLLLSAVLVWSLVAWQLFSQI